MSFLPSFCNRLFLHYALALIIANPYNIYFRLLNHMPAHFPQDKRESLEARIKEL